MISRCTSILLISNILEWISSNLEVKGSAFLVLQKIALSFINFQKNYHYFFQLTRELGILFQYMFSVNSKYRSNYVYQPRQWLLQKFSILTHAIHEFIENRSNFTSLLPMTFRKWHWYESNWSMNHINTRNSSWPLQISKGTNITWKQ